MLNSTVTMRAVMRVLAIIVGATLLLAGAFAFGMGSWGRGYVHDQLSQENITMPDQETIDGDTGLSDEDKDALKGFAGEQMTEGAQAQAYANNYIYPHMMHSCTEVTSADGQTTFDAVPADKCTYAGVGGVARAAESEEASQAYNGLRDSLFRGSMLRGALLNTYGWSILATIGFYAGIALVLAGLGLLVAAFTVLKPVRSTTR